MSTFSNYYISNDEKIIYKYNYFEEQILKVNEINEIDILIIDDYTNDHENWKLWRRPNVAGRTPNFLETTKSSEENCGLFKEILQKHIQPYGEVDSVTDDLSHEFSEISFQCTSNDYSYIAIVFLTQDAHVDSGIITYTDSHVKKDKIANIYNRLIIINTKNIGYIQEYTPNRIKHRKKIIYFNIKPKITGLPVSFPVKRCCSSDISVDKIRFAERRPNSSGDLRSPTELVAGGVNAPLPNVIVIDNFYKNPDNVRKLALLQDIEREGNYPGNRTSHFITYEIKNKLQSIFESYGKITIFEMVNQQTSNGCFQLTLSKNRSWIHTDYNENISLNTNWAGVLYLTPNAPFSSGTDIYDFKYKDDHTNYNEYSQDVTKWNKRDSIGNVYNRLILFNSQQWHMSGDYFGKDKNDGRLTQVFFIRIE